MYDHVSLRQTRLCVVLENTTPLRKCVNIIFLLRADHHRDHAAWSPAETLR